MNIRSIISALIITIMISSQTQSFEPETEPVLDISDTTKFEQVFILGLGGNISSALNFLDTIDNAALTERQLRLKEKFYSRFRSMDENYAFPSTDTTVNKLHGLYIQYWRSAMLDNVNLQKYDAEHTKVISAFLRENYEKVRYLTEEDLQENFTEHLQYFLKTKGIFAAVGKTGMFFDLLLHAKETEVIYEVTTPEDTINVKVVFMEDILSNGWEDYATFGKYYPGGWATSDALFCIKQSYDLESENFLVSYLKHEGKHFADYKQFPKLTGADLEYRAKLVELSAAKTDLFKLIKFFLNNSDYNRQNPHGFANFCAMRDLSRMIFSKDLESNIEKWKEISPDMINANAELLLKKNTVELRKAGSETVTEYIK